VTANADEYKSVFEQDPSNIQAFSALEEHYFMAGRWNDLATLYERRLTAPEFEADAQRSVPILFRLAQLCEERCLAIDLAIENYWKVAKLDPSYRPALRQLRSIYTRREQWDMVLQIAEMEGALAMENHQRADFHTELGKVWASCLNDPTEALGQFQTTLELVPDHIEALKGLAGVHTSLGHHDHAAAAWERLGARMRGPDRASIMVALGTVLRGHLGQTDRAVACFEQALEDDPRCADAIEALLVIAAAREDWALVAHLNDRRFDIAAGARKRAAVSVEAGMLCLERLDDIQAARMWFDRAIEIVDDDVTVHEAYAELERRTGNRTALAQTLARVMRIRGDKTPTSTLLEAADLHSEAGEEEKAVELLQRAREKAPDDALVAETLSDSLARLGRTDELIEILEQRAAMANIEPQAEAELRAEIGRIHLEDLEDLDTAVASFARAFEIDPRMKGIAGHLESLYRKREDWTALRALLETAITDGPPIRRPHFHAALGEVLEQQFDESDAAVEAYEAAIELNPECQTAHDGVNRMVHASGEPEVLLRVCLREAEVTTDRARLSELVDKMVPLLEERDRNDEALGWVERVWQWMPSDRRVLEEVIRLREALGRHEDTIEPLERLDPILGGESQARNRRKLAATHERAGNSDEAIRWWEATVDREPNDVEALRSLADLYDTSGDLEALARARRRLADALPEGERVAELERLASLLVDRLGDIDGAIVVLRKLVKFPEDERPEGAFDQLEALLQRAGRFEELAQRWLERRRDLDSGSSEAYDLDLRRARLYLEDLGQFDLAAEIYRALHERDDQDERALEGLERALRLGNDADQLVDLLQELAVRADDPQQRAELELERATLLEKSLGAFDEASDLLSKVAGQSELGALAERAGERLERLLERSGEWEALRERLEGRLGGADDEARFALHEELAHLCRDRLNDREGCVAHFEAAGELAPDRETIWHTLALLYSELDRPADQLRAIEHELDLDVDRERKTMLLALAARLASDLPDADDRCSRHYERLLELEPGHAEASEYLVAYYEREDQPADIVRLLGARLEAALAGPDDEPTRVSTVLSLRLRIAGLQSQRLEDDEAAAATLEPAIDEVGPRGEVARPLADLYHRLSRSNALISLCDRAAGASNAPEERASWNLELADTLHKTGERERAVEAYDRVCEDRPDDRDAHTALLTLHRELENVEPLVACLERELSRASERKALPLRLELGELLETKLDRPRDAAKQYDAVLAEDSRHPEAYLHSVAISRRLDDPERTRALLDQGLECATSPGDRAALLEQIGELEAGPLEDIAAAVSRFREALGQDPTRHSARECLIEILGALGRHQELLDCLFLEAQQKQGDERCAVYERAAGIARRELSTDAALPWLERLHGERPEDADVLRRIADVHRQAGRHEALLRTLETQLALDPASDARHALHCDMAGVYERDLAAPGRAALALEAAHEIDANDANVLADLDRLYDALGRHADRARMIEERILCEGTSPNLLPVLHRGAARLWQEHLSAPHTAVRHLLHSLALGEADDDEHLALLRRLQECLHQCGRLDGWARAAERELEWLEEHGDRDPAGEHDARRCELHFALAERYDHELARPTRALGHLLALIDNWRGAPLSEEQLEHAEAALLRHLRAEHNHVELERRLAARLERVGGNADDWLERARLEDEHLFMPSAARAAYREVLVRDEENLEAIHGLHKTAKALGDWPGVAEAIDLELALSTPPEHDVACGLLRQLGEIARDRLTSDDAHERANDAYRKLLERVPGDLESLRALQSLAEVGQAWDDAIARYEEEAEHLGEEESERRHEIWLRVAEIARDQNGNLDRAIEAFGRADGVAELSLERTREWADLYQKAEDWTPFADVFARWCDSANSPAGCSDLIELSEVLESIGREHEAIERAEMAIEADPQRAAAHEAAARLREASNDASRAADHYAAAAERSDSSKAIEHLLSATRLIAEPEPERAAELLRRALDHDASCAEAHARLAILCERIDAHHEGHDAAGRALDLCGAPDSLPEGLLLQAASAGARAALALEERESATRLFCAVRELDPENIEALSNLGELFYASHDLESAREVLEARHAVSDGAEDQEDGAQGAAKPRQLAIIGEAHEAIDECARALEAFEAALDTDPALDQAHAGIVRIREGNDDKSHTLRALDRWIEVQEDDRERSRALFRAACIDQAEDRTERATDRLRTACEADPANAGAWTLLADLLLGSDEHDAALEATTSGLAVIDADDHENVATLAFVRATALERAGEFADAITAYAQAVENDPCQADAVLGQARLLRNRGDWQQASDALEAFLAAHPQPSEPTLAQVAYERGQLLAGPLEDVDEAIRCYEQAVNLDADFTRAVEPLANLLSYMPERWEEAVRQHATLLREDPARDNSIRALAKIAEGRGDRATQQDATAVLNALGATTFEERDGAPERLAMAMAHPPQLEGQHDERVRKLIVSTVDELRSALAGQRDETRATEHSNRPEGEAAFLTTLEAVEAELSFATLHEVPLDALAGAVRQLGALAWDTSASGVDSVVAEQLDRAIGRWARRKLRKGLEGTETSDLENLDWATWRDELRGVAATIALDRQNGDLRSALLALSADPRDADAEQLAADIDIRDRVRHDNLASALLAHVTSTLCQKLSPQQS
jgi:tetratricopeptide (TPR) repeat protein